MQEDEIFALFDRFRYITPQGSPLSAIGNNWQVQSLSNCYVIPKVIDSYCGILYSDQQLVQIMKRRGGGGVCIDNLRPKGLVTRNAAKTTGGIAVFMKRFSNSCREVAQGGRRGALMICLSAHHPEIETFIKIKQDKTSVTGANLSVKFSDEFMEAVLKDKEYETRWPVNAEKPVVSKMIPARKVWEMFIEASWGFG